MAESTGKVILVAGALGTAGIAVAEGFRAKGATVLIAPGQFPPDLMTLYAGFSFIAGEVSSPAELALRCDEVVAEHGGLDLVVFCSGANHTADAEEPVSSNSFARRPSFAQRLRIFVTGIF